MPLGDLRRRGRRAAVGVRSFAGRFWRSRARLTDSPIDAAVLDGAGDVVVGGDDQLVELAAVVVLVGAALERRELVRAHDRAVDERGGVRVGEVVRELPAEDASRRARGRGRARWRRRSARARGRTPRACRARPRASGARRRGSGRACGSRCGPRRTRAAPRARRRGGRARRPRRRRRRPRSCRRRWLRGRRWWRGRPLRAARILECSSHVQHRDPRHRPHPRRQARRRPVVAPGHGAGRDRDQGGPRARGRRARPGPARRDGPGAAGRPGADPLAPGADRGRHPQGGLLRDHQQGLRLERARGRHPRRRDPRR